MGKIKELTLEKQKLELKIQEIELQIAALLDEQPESTPVPTPESTPEPTPNPTPEPTPESTPVPTPTPEPTPTAPVNISVEVEVGNWSIVPNSVIITKTTNDTTWLLQTDKNRSYYFIRGINHLDDKNVTLTKPVDRTKLSNEYTALGGLFPAANGDLPAKWDNTWWKTNGFVKNNNNEFVKSDVILTPTTTLSTTQPIVTPTIVPIKNKITIPIGAIMWDGWYEDYQLNPRTGISGNPYERGINQASSLRWDLTEFASLNVVPFYGQQNLTPETIEIITKVTWNPTLGENEYETTHKKVTCKFDRSQAAFDKEIGFALDAGIDYMAFNWYSPYDTPMAEGQRKFVDSNNRETMKMCYLSGPIGWNIPINVDYITDRMLESYYQQIDGKPLLFVNDDWLNQTYAGTTILQSIMNSYASKSRGGSIYVVYMSGGRDYPTDESKYSNHRMSCASIYTTYGVEGYGPRPHTQIMDDEVRLREYFIKNSGRDIIPVVTTGFVNANKRSEIGLLDPINYYNNYTEAATTSQMDTKMTNLISFIENNPTRTKAILFYAWNENSESGNPICPTLTSGTTSINVSSLNVSGSNSGVNRATLDKVKQYCKK